MTPNTQLAAIMLLAAMSFSSSAIPQTKAAPTAGAVLLPSDAAGSATIDDHRARRRSSTQKPYGYPWS
jgi:hypothetical protein